MELDFWKRCMQGSFRARNTTRRWKRAKKEFDITYDNLAVPEIHTGLASQPKTDEKAEPPGISIEYDNLTIPEIHTNHTDDED